MRWWLAKKSDQLRTDWLKRFDPRFWTVDFPRPMMASVVTTAPDALRVDAVFYTGSDLAGLIWASEDLLDHPLLAYETRRDYRGLTLSFRWRTGGVLPLDAAFGPVLTIEGRDQAGVARTWYVRLWNYATGVNTDAKIVLDFSRLVSGFALPGEQVYAGDIDRMFISLVPVGYTGGAAPLPAPVEGWAEMSSIACDGAQSTIRVGDAFLPEHWARIAGGYDDNYNQTPARLLRQVQALGYREWIDHYVGMSHFFRLSLDATAGKWIAGTTAPSPLNVAAAAWHRDFLARAGEIGMQVILSLSYELFDAHAPDAWKQRSGDGEAARTGYSPPSTLLSPANTAAMAYLQSVAQALAALATAAGQAVNFQIGEPWWWVGADGKPCLYDASTVAAYTAETGAAPPPPVLNAGANLSTAQRVYFDWAGRALGRSTIALRDSVRAGAPEARISLLFFTPQVLYANADTLSRLNLPAAWAWPTFDILQIEDYDFVTAGNAGAAARARAFVQARLGYPPGSQHYFAGFVQSPGNTTEWARIAAAETAANAGPFAQTFLWALPQIVRDGFTMFSIGETVQSYDDVPFPLAIGAHATMSVGFFTQIVTSASGYEQRNAQWTNARMRFDAGLGVRSEADIIALINFFRARRGSAAAFPFRDPMDFSSDRMAGQPGATDQLLGNGDGLLTEFAIVKTYDPALPGRRITRPVPTSVRVSVAGTEMTSGWSLGPLGLIQFEAAPSIGSEIRAGYLFDVPVRFETDSLDISLGSFRSGAVPTVSLIEVKEG